VQSGRAKGCTVLHVDMDAFFASVEVRRHPELAGTPVIVGGAGNRGVVTSATYEARRYGVHAAMPIARALRLCPTATVLPGDLALYSEVSRSVMALFRSITPLVEPLSLDEAFLDVSGAGRRLGDAAEIGEYLRARVYDEQGITCSVGVAGTKFVAKLASTRAKPDGLLVVRPPEVMDFLHPLPVGALWGVGPKTEEVLLRLGMRTVGDLAHVPAKTLQRALGVAAGGHLHELAWGRDPRRVVPEESEKSIGHEETFSTDIDDPAVIHREFLLLAERTAGRLRSGGWLTRTVSIKVRFADFSTITRSRTLDVPSDVGQELYETARALFDALGLDRARIRLVGVRAERLIDAGSAPQQLELGAREHGRRDAELAADRAARRFGAGAVRPATLLRRDGRPGAMSEARSEARSGKRTAGGGGAPEPGFRPGSGRKYRTEPHPPAGPLD
jgi:DNA polymerase-4